MDRFVEMKKSSASEKMLYGWRGGWLAGRRSRGRGHGLSSVDLNLRIM